MSQTQEKYTYAFSSGKTEYVFAYDEDSADYIAANLSALYGWGEYTLISVSSRTEVT